MRISYCSFSRSAIVRYEQSHTLRLYVCYLHWFTEMVDRLLATEDMSVAILLFKRFPHDMYESDLISVGCF